MKPSINHNDVSLFCHYFLNNPKHTYQQYSENEGMTMLKIDCIRKKLQRDLILISTKENDDLGRFFSVKKIDLIRLRKKYQTNL